MSRNNTAIFSTGDAAYLKQMAVALYVACSHNPQLDPWIITDAPKEETKFLEKYGISVIRLDLKKEYDVFNETWPSQSFWWSIGPNMFNDLGYDYSIFIDGDVYCVNPIDMNVFNDDLEIAARSDANNMYNSGVMLFNNKKLVEKNFYNAALSCYRVLSTDAFERWHGGKVHDQQVLSSLAGNNEMSEFTRELHIFDVQDLSLLWNYPLHLQSGREEEHRELLKLSYTEIKEKLYFVHFLGSRPWLPFKKWGSRHHGLFRSNDFPNGWIVRSRSSEPDPTIRIQFVTDWRKDVEVLADLYNEQLFEKFEDLVISF